MALDFRLLASKTVVDKMSGAHNVPQLYLTCPALRQLPTPVLPHLSPCSHQHMSAYIHREEVCLFVRIKWNRQIHVTCFLPHFTVGIVASRYSNFFILRKQTHNQLSYSINRIGAERLKVDYCRYFHLHQNLFFSFFSSFTCSPDGKPSPPSSCSCIYTEIHRIQVWGLGSFGFIWSFFAKRGS